MKLVGREEINEGGGVFDDIGKKIKLVAKAIFWIIIVLCLAVAFFVEQQGEVGLYIAIIILCAGILVAWFGSYLLYGFGELIDNSTQIRKILEKMANEKP